MEGRGAGLAIAAIVFPSVALASVGARFVCRHNYARHFGVDDGVIAFSMICSIGLASATVFSVYHGVGKHISTLDAHDRTEALIAFWASQIIYKLAVNSTKLSINFSYLRIFRPSQNPRFAIVVISVMTFIGSYATASIIATFFQCKPVHRAWNHSVQGRCINLTAFWEANAISNIVGDILTWALPARMIWKLRLPMSERVGICSVFGLGLFVCIASLFRMTTLSSGSKNPDTTYGTMLPTLWSNVEVNVGIICACLPILKKPIFILYKKCAASRSLSGSGSGGGRVWERRVRPVRTYFRARGASRGEEGLMEEEGRTRTVPMGEIHKRTDVRVMSDVEVETGKGAERMWPGVVCLP